MARPLTRRAWLMRAGLVAVGGLIAACPRWPPNGRRPTTRPYVAYTDFNTGLREAWVDG